MSLDMLILPLFALGSLFALIVLWIVAQSLFGGGSRKTRKRIETTRARAMGQTGGGAKTASAADTNVRRTQKEGMPVFEKMVRDHLPRASMLRSRLARTGTELTPGTYVLFNIATIIAVCTVIRVFSTLSLGMVILMGTAVGLYLPHMIVGMIAGRRAEKFIAAFPDAIDLMVRGLKSGLPISEALASVGRELPDPIGPEFRRVSDSIKMGQSMEASLWETSDRLDIQEFKFFVISLSVQRETGGNLAETLGNLSEVLRSRKTMKLKIKALSSEARASAYILGSLPFLMFAILMIINRDYVLTLFTTTGGWTAVGVALGSISVGIFVMYKMVKFEI